jgi:hypothetical protein
MDGCYNY